MVIEHCQCWSPLLRSQNFTLPLIQNVNFIKQKLKISYPEGFEPWSPWLGTRNYSNRLETR